MVIDSIKNFFTNQVPEDTGEIFLEWTFPQFQKVERTQRWYIGTFLAGAALLVYSILTINFLFAIIVLLFAFIAVFQHYQKPQTLSVKITEDGVIVGQNFYPYKSLYAFWFNYNPPQVKNLYLGLKSSLRGTVTIPLNDASPLEAREILEQFLFEDLDKEPEASTEFMRRLLKF